MSSLTTQQALTLALQHLQMERFEEASALYRQILAEDPDHPDALGMLGVIAYQSGRLEEAVDLLRQAIARNPRSSVYPSNLGMVMARQGQYAEAIAAFRRALSLRPDFPEALNNLGIALQESGKPQEAVPMYEKAIALRPDDAQARHNLGNALASLDRLDDAIAAYREALEIRSNNPEARLHLGNALYQKGQSHEAMAAYQELLENWPDYPEAHVAMGHLLKEIGKTDQAIAHFQEAARLKPDFPEALHNLGVMLHDSGQIDDAIAMQRRAIAVRPDFADAHFSLSWGLLTKGEFREGWEEHEWRMRRWQWAQTAHKFSQTLWDGSELQGRRLLLHSEQGFGDTIQFIRYVALVARRAADFTLLCQAPLRRLLSGQLGIRKLIASDEDPPGFDVHCPLMSLPRVFETTLETIPAQVPYLRAEERRAEEFRSRTSGFRVGLAWAGSGSFVRDRGRSIHLEQLSTLASVPGVTLCSLQKDPPAQDVGSPLSCKLVDWTSELTDFADTAALIAALDLVICIDTAVAHLAGALGKPVWVLLPFASDWRWLRGRSDSPWYPTMRLFRQPRPGDWETPIRQVIQQLRDSPRG